MVGAKNKLTAMLDKMDVEDKHYDRKYQDMQDRLGNLYDKISELEVMTNIQPLTESKPVGIIVALLEKGSKNTTGGINMLNEGQCTGYRNEGLPWTN